jgi:ribonuclease HI
LGTDGIKFLGFYSFLDYDFDFIGIKFFGLNKNKFKFIYSSMRVYIDGSCIGNPGPGGWGVYADDTGEHYYGRSKETTNNQMELTAAIEALSRIKCDNLEIMTDSNYVLFGITSWIKSWKTHNWKTAAKKPVLNEGLWRKLDAAVNDRPVGSIKWTKVAAHSNNAGNDIADFLAKGVCKLKFEHTCSCE